MERRRRHARVGHTEPVVIGDGPAGIGSNVDGLGQAPASHGERVARRAYQRFEERGGAHGRDMEDWFEAERDLMSQNGGE